MVSDEARPFLSQVLMEQCFHITQYGRVTEMEVLKVRVEKATNEKIERLVMAGGYKNRVKH